MWPFGKKRAYSIRTKRAWGEIWKTFNVFSEGILVAKLVKRDGRWKIEIRVDGYSRWRRQTLHFSSKNRALDYFETKFNEVVMDDVLDLFAKRDQKVNRLAAETKLAEDDRKKFERKRRRLEQKD